MWSTTSLVCTHASSDAELDPDSAERLALIQKQSASALHASSSEGHLEDPEPDELAALDELVSARRPRAAGPKLTSSGWG